MRYPKFLNQNGRIGFIAPSFACATEPYATCFEAACARFRDMGYELAFGPNCREACGIGKSNTAEACGAEINEFFTGDRSDIIISCGGGETMCEDLQFVDFEAIASAEPKWFLGYSDNTNLTFTLPTLCDTAAIYGPCAAAFGTSPRHPALQDALDLLTGRKLTMHNYPLWEKEEIEDPENLTAPYNVTEPFCGKAYLPGSGFVYGMPENDASGTVPSLAFSGRLIGGCVDCLINLCGTSFDKAAEFAERYKEDGIIWFLECCDLNPMGMRRAMWQLKSAGWFKHVKGFLIGRPLHFEDEMMGANRLNSVTDILGDLNVPILMDLDIGHLPPAMPLISGAAAEVTFAAGHLTVKMDLK